MSLPWTGVEPKPGISPVLNTNREIQNKTIFFTQHFNTLISQKFFSRYDENSGTGVTPMTSGFQKGTSLQNWLTVSAFIEFKIFT